VCPAWAAEADKLYALTLSMAENVDTSDDVQYAAYSRRHEAFLEMLVQTCSEALCELAKSGLFHEFQDVVFYVGSTDESGDIIRERDAIIRRMIASLRLTSASRARPRRP
jgi:hypothetical protein